MCRYELTEADTEVTLSVNEAEKCDTGDYTIRVENALATDTASFHIAITGTVFFSTSFKKMFGRYIFCVFGH